MKAIKSHNLYTYNLFGGGGGSFKTFNIHHVYNILITEIKIKTFQVQKNFIT